MNKQLYFIFGFLSAVLLTSMFASVSALNWEKFRLWGNDGDGEDDVAALSPGYPPSLNACRASSSVNAREVSACTKVTAPLGLFNRLETSQLLIRTASNLQNEGYLFGESAGGGLRLRTVFANGASGDGVLILDDLMVTEGADVGSLNVGDLRGTGNATVCVDTYGHIYRSPTPCR
ncbi:MAG TPA: hypothetical protein VJK07_00780 [Candidatus Nanoarchaeia archaeon]|nr:hypothetical protein [Candidatus Nanoarchaeia archaeon]